MDVNYVPQRGPYGVSCKVVTGEKIARRKMYASITSLNQILLSDKDQVLILGCTLGRSLLSTTALLYS